MGHLASAYNNAIPRHVHIRRVLRGISSRPHLIHKDHVPVMFTVTNYQETNNICHVILMENLCNCKILYL